jgi:anti-sigma28 factor (negative regulator of flagellin synthesis)
MPRPEVPIDPSMERQRPKPESPADRALRIAWLRESIAAGNYFVPAEVVARSLLRRLGLELLDLQHQ